ncbi:MAG: hypothetical protein EA351_09180 [Gemmatimonadales bacterium]|nr:MAG: hypothetical protein EA351_09180 [Gemmatimonadales bacterium]
MASPSSRFGPAGRAAGSIPGSRRIGTALSAALGLLTLLAVLPSVTAAQQAVDQRYTDLIHEFTTEDFFLTPLVDHLPASDLVPTPLDVIGYISGTRDSLTYAEDVHRYMRAVADVSPRVTVETIGTSEEGREILLVLVSDERTIQELGTHKELMGRLADPRGISEEEASEIISTVKPMYWATGAIHSSETGSPEMLMELVYRLAVDEGEFIRTIRDNMIVMVTPVVEPDGRNKVVDVHMAPRRNPDGINPNRTLYWGQYVYHSNNRDGMSLSLNLSRAITGTYLEYHPIVVHDLHESASYLYTSTGRGPYNAWLDPMTISEWNRLAHKEVREMTAFGVPGVYTHDFYDGWTPNYMFWVAHLHNSIGRFYETQAARNAADYVLRTNVDRAWHRPNTPLREVVWSIRNNTNLMQSALLIALNEVANNREEYLTNFWTKSKRAVAKAHMEGPAGYVLPGDDPRPGQQARLLQNLQGHGIEVHRTTASVTIGDDTFPSGSYVVRMDQPYSRGADMLLDRQYYSPDDPRPYDDVGWTYGPLYNATTVRVDDVELLDAPMQRVEGRVAPEGGVVEADSDATAAFVIRYNADNNLAAFRFAHGELSMQAARQGFEAAGEDFGPGSFIVPVDGNPGDLGQLLDDAGREYGFTAHAVTSLPSVSTHAVALPRIAVVHTWLTTQNEGWLRIGLDEYGIPYDYVSVHEIRDTPDLGSRWDVLLFGPSTGNALQHLHGVQGDDPIPWEATEVTPNIGRQASTSDIRGGLELTGIMNLQRFVEEGGTLITLTNSSALPIHFGIAAGVGERNSSDLWAPGGVFRADRTDDSSPLAYGYGESLGVYFNQNQSPLLTDGRSRPGSQVASQPDGSTTQRLSSRGGVDEDDVVQGHGRDWGRESIEAWEARQEEESTGGAGAGWGGGGSSNDVRTVFRYHSEPTELLISGGLVAPRELTGTPALIDARIGEGHVILFSFNPFWRSGTLGSYALVFNALLHHGNLHAGSAIAEEDH